MNYKYEIDSMAYEAYKKGIDFGLSGRDGSDNSYIALEKVKETISTLSEKQKINLSSR